MAMPHTLTPFDRAQYYKEAIARMERHRLFAKMAENEGNLEERDFWLKHAEEAAKMASYWSKIPE